jgi:hypothetical protein
MRKHLLITVLLMGLSAISARALAEPANADDSVSRGWGAFKQDSREAWEGMKAGSKKAWKATKKGSKEAAKGVSEGSKSLWESFKESFE